ncbi:MAG: DUF1598 domain-containing protein, partial [Thermoguttaceae bacterium]|nr:DUF1598 domain-containing protein [Thermoguttaceae bacterium]
GGVLVDANGVLQRVVVDDGVLAAARNEAFASIPSEMRAPSKLRKVSLNRLEAQIVANNGVVSDEMANLAGLTRIENVFVYPETGDVVIAGPAEGWKVGVDGAIVGAKSGRPTLQLQDLVVALRAYPAEGKSAEFVGCSIDPTEAGLRNMQAYLKTAAQPQTDADRVNYAAGIREALGLQDVNVWGVSPKTNFAATLVAADYRMKLIGVGLEEAPVKLVTYAEKSNPRVNASNGLVRWYFQPNYDCVVETENGDALQLVGNGVTLVGEDELVGADGSRSANTGRGNPATKAYAKSFTSKFEKIADEVPVYASLRNLIDMTIVAAYLQKEGVYAKTNWTPDFFADEEKFQTETLNEVQFAETAVNVINHKGGITSYPTGGGVHIEPQIALDVDHVKYDEKGTVEARREKSENNDPNSWWWD